MAGKHPTPPANSKERTRNVGGFRFKTMDLDGPPATVEQFIDRARQEHAVYMVAQDLVKHDDRALVRRMRLVTDGHPERANEFLDLIFRLHEWKRYHEDAAKRLDATVARLFAALERTVGKKRWSARVPR
ncbi:MAG: hypothetical protein ACE5Q3_20375 [Alphaproteobacteria bacterium]